MINKNGGISIIIPCLNEEYYLGKLLYCLTQQTYKNFEVIIVDGKSEDRTCEIAKKYFSGLPRIKVITSNKRQIAYQRNLGGKYANFEQILFLDADTQVKQDFLSLAIREIEKRKLDMATAPYKPLSNRFDDNFLFFLGSCFIGIMQYLSPVSMGWCIFSTRTLHKRIQGFNEDYKFSEDFNYSQRAVRSGAKLRVLRTTVIYVSVRRLQKEGRINYTKRAIRSGLYVLSKKKLIKKPANMEFGHFKEEKYVDKFCI